MVFCYITFQYLRSFVDNVYTNLDVIGIFTFTQSGTYATSLFIPEFPKFLKTD